MPLQAGFNPQFAWSYEQLVVLHYHWVRREAQAAGRSDGWRAGRGGMQPDHLWCDAALRPTARCPGPAPAPQPFAAPTPAAPGTPAAAAAVNPLITKGLIEGAVRLPNLPRYVPEALAEPGERSFDEVYAQVGAGPPVRCQHSVHACT